MIFMTKRTKEKQIRPVTLIILDGFGIRKEQQGNAVAMAKMPVWKRLRKAYPDTKLKADGRAVGLPKGQVGNSEAGHMTIGAGRPVQSDMVRINKEIEKRTFRDNPALLRTLAHVTRNNSTLHLMGLLTGEQSGHSHIKHLLALLRFVGELRLSDVVLHLFTDGRDTPPHHAPKLVAEVMEHLPENVRIGSVTGRYYAMDRNLFWDRTRQAYEALVQGKGRTAKDAMSAVEKAYDLGESDEYIKPTIIASNREKHTIGDHDAVIFWNLRSDRARQLTKPFVMDDFETEQEGAFKRKKVLKDLFFVTLTEFGTDIDTVVAAYPNVEVSCTLVEVLRSHEQVYIAESEKYAHVTYFFNGGHDRARFNEKRINIPTKKVARYDEKPRMQVIEIAKNIKASLEQDADFICANFANADMVAHSGNLEATVKACEALDDGLKIVWEAVQKHDGYLIVTADHGNAEQMIGEKGMPDTEHNPNPVPFLIAGKGVKSKRLRSKGELADIAPTILDLFNLEKPKAMTGRSLLKR